MVAARLILNRTSVGFHLFSSVENVQTYAFRSWEQVTIRFELGAQSIEVISLSCCEQELGRCAREEGQLREEIRHIKRDVGQVSHRAVRQHDRRYSQRWGTGTSTRVRTSLSVSEWTNPLGPRL